MTNVTSTTTVCAPDLSERPLQLTVERTMRASPRVLYRAWTEHMDRWFAHPGSVLMMAEVNKPFFFETMYNNRRSPHYGRFLRLDADRLVELTWVTGAGGTEGAETVVTVALTPVRSGAHLRLTQSGWPNEQSRDRAAAAWSLVLAQLDERMAVEQG